MTRPDHSDALSASESPHPHAACLGKVAKVPTVARSLYTNLTGISKHSLGASQVPSSVNLNYQHNCFCSPMQWQVSLISRRVSRLLQMGPRPRQTKLQRHQGCNRGLRNSMLPSSSNFRDDLRRLLTISLLLKPAQVTQRCHCSRPHSDSSATNPTSV